MNDDIVSESAALCTPGVDRLDDGLEAVLLYQRRLHETHPKLTNAFDRHGIAHAVIGGRAVQHYVASADPHAVRTINDLDLLIQRTDLPLAAELMHALGLKYRDSGGVHRFLFDVAHRSGVHILFTGERSRSHYTLPAPPLEGLVRISEEPPLVPLHLLTASYFDSYRDKDKMHLRDMIDVELLPGNVM